MEERLIKEYADLISFRLLATKNHQDYEWLISILKKISEGDKIGQIMGKGSEADIEWLKIKLKLYLHEEKYERAEVIKQWIIELGGNPEIKNIDELLVGKNKKNGK